MDIGTAYLIKGKVPQAIGSLSKAAKIDPRNPVIHNNLGVAYFNVGKYDHAHKHFKQAVKLKSKYTDARNNLAGLYIEVGKYKSAEAELEICLSDMSYPKPEKIHMNMGLAKFFLKKYDKALVHLKKTLEYRREHCQAMTYYGRANYELKKYQIASKSLDQAVYFCRNIKYDEPYFYSGLSFIRNGNTTRGKARLRELVALYPKR